jgi:hypothetical protein
MSKPTPRAVCEGYRPGGAYSVLEEQGYEPQNMAGDSASAIVAALLAAGYDVAGSCEISSRSRITTAKDEASLP